MTWDLVLVCIVLLAVRWIMYFNGYRPVVLVADLEVLKNVQIRNFQDFLDRALLFQNKRPSSPHDKSIMQLMGTRWKEMSGGVISTVEELMGRLQQVAEKNEEFEIGPMYQALTLDLISRSALGINLKIQQNPKHPFLTSINMLFGCTFSFIAVLLEGTNGLNHLSKTVLDDDDITQNAFFVLVAGVASAVFSEDAWSTTLSDVPCSSARRDPSARFMTLKCGPGSG
ncbi:hypothetical protein HPB47_009679 [Ixodes persulcatus]|uniref:Uncharacterized protein n=1 Tax=Ixodes persulcatus TaxID=34615 RepID=A0AC60P1I8_IXOPE|nr:hypothetical protein HPB47_009679 [Ixodes persulcatus]